MASRADTLVLIGEDNQRLRVRLEKGAASALSDKGLTKTEVINLLTEALGEIEQPPGEGEALAVVVAGILLAFEFTDTGLVVAKFTD
jgi:hypothetical protein